MACLYKYLKYLDSRYLDSRLRGNDRMIRENDCPLSSRTSHFCRSERSEESFMFQYFKILRFAQNDNLFHSE